jgi:hypothetical protein
MEVRSRRSFEKSPRRTTHPLLVMAKTIGSFVAKPEQRKCHTDNPRSTSCAAARL